MTKKKFKQIFRIVLFVGTAISLFYVPWVLVFAWLTPLPDTIQQEVDAAINKDFDGIIVYVDKSGEPSACYTAGWHNREAKIPAKPDALFKIASVGKLYHAVAITKLVAANRLSLDSTLAYYFPELVGKIDNANKITLRMIVQHRSGIPNFTDTPDYWNKPAKDSDDALERIKGLPSDFEPGTDYEYSNTNYLLLSELINKVTGNKKFQYMKEEILDPLGIKNTFASINDVNMDDVMSGYYVGIDNDIKDSNYGSMLSTAEDLAKFIRALNDGSLFKKGEKEIYSSIYVYNHTGLIPGYQTIAKYHPDIDAVVIQFVNTTNFSGYTWNMSEIVYGRVIKILKKKGINH